MPVIATAPPLTARSTTGQCRHFRTAGCSCLSPSPSFLTSATCDAGSETERKACEHTGGARLEGAAAVGIHGGGGGGVEGVQHEGLLVCPSQRQQVVQTLVPPAPPQPPFLRHNPDDDVRTRWGPWRWGEPWMLRRCSVHEGCGWGRGGAVVGARTHGTIRGAWCACEGAAPPCAAASPPDTCGMAARLSGMNVDRTACST